MADCIKRYFVCPDLLPRFGEEKQEKKISFHTVCHTDNKQAPLYRWVYTGLCGYTLHRRVYTLHVGIHCTCGYTLYRWVYTVHLGIPKMSKNVKKCQKSPNLSENVKNIKNVKNTKNVKNIKKCQKYRKC